MKEFIEYIDYIKTSYRDYVISSTEALEQQTQLHIIQCIFGSVSIQDSSIFHSQDSVLYSVYSSIVIDLTTVYDLSVTKSPITIIESTASIANLSAKNISVSDSSIELISVSYSTLNLSDIEYSFSEARLYDLMFVTGSLSHISAYNLSNVLNIGNMRTSTIDYFQHSSVKNVS